MKRLLGCFLLVLSLAAGCKKDNSDSKACSTITAFSVTQKAHQISISLSADGTHSYFEVSYQVASSSPQPDAGTKFIVNAASIQKKISELNLGVGETYIFYARAVCTEGPGEWTGNTQAVTIASYCDVPYDLMMANNGLGMALYWDAPFAMSEFQVQYGETGFALGSGTVRDVHNLKFFDDAAMAANRTYDFYVRGNCGTSGWSEWAGPLKYQATENQFMCIAPSDVKYTVSRNGAGQAVGANFEWSLNGELSFEFTVVRRGDPVSSGNIYTATYRGWPTLLLTQKTDYDFYVRAVCIDGNRTNWTGPLQFNIGQ